jgi:hypothetical protein
MRQCLLPVLPMQLDILQISLDSSAIHSHSFEVGTDMMYIGCSTLQVTLPDARKMSCIVFFPT